MQYVRGDVDTLVKPVTFEAKVLENTTLPAPDRSELVAFQGKASKLYKAMRGAQEFTEDMNERLQYIKQAIQNTPGASMELMAKAENTQKAIDDIMWKFKGKDPKASREENPPAEQPLNQRLNDMVWSHWGSTAGITETEKQQYEILSEEFPPVLDEIKKVYKEDILELEKALDEMDAPWTPGRIPDWEKE